MQFRALFLLLSLALATGCGGEAASDDDANGDAVDLALRFDPNEPQSMLPGASVELAVRCVDRAGKPVAGVEVALALLGEAPGVSLNDVSPRTDGRGIARTSLRAGSEATTFRVRASAQGADTAFLQISVAAVDSSVTVDVLYDGQRMLATRTVTARPNVGCKAALADRMPGQVNQTIGAPRTMVTLDLDPGVRYAVVAWGRDAAGGLLARGCTNIKYAIGDEPDAHTVELLDHTLTLVQPETGPFEVELELDVSASSARLGAAARDAGLAKLPTTAEPDADAMLDAVETVLRAAGGEPAVAAVALARKDSAVASSLGQALRSAMVGPTVLLGALDTLLTTDAERLVAEASYAVDASSNMQFQVVALYGSRAGGLPLPLSDALLSATQVTFAALFDEPRALIDVSDLGLTIRLSAYGLAVLDALEMSQPEGVLGLLSSARGCNVLSTWSAAQPAVSASCDAACVQQACDALGQGLIAAARDRVASLSGYTSLTLSGPVWVADRDDNNLVDEVGSTLLEGTWHGDAAVLTDTDAVTGELRMAPPPLAP